MRCGMLATHPLLRHDSWLVEIGSPKYMAKSSSADLVLPETAPAAKVFAMCLTCIVIYAQAQNPKSHTHLDWRWVLYGEEHKHKSQACCATIIFQTSVV